MGAKSSRHDEVHPDYYMLGLAGSGKTTTIQRLDKERSLGIDNSVSRAFPPEVFNNIEEIDSEWYISGRDSRRPMYYFVSKALLGFIFVFDSTNVERLDQAIAQLNQFLYVTSDSDSEGPVIMILANKQDLDGAVTPEYIETKVKEGCKLTFESSLFVMPCCAVQGNSLLVAYDYFLEQSKLKKEGKLPIGLIPSAWESVNWEKAEERLNETDDVTVEKRDSTIVHKMKKSVFKNPFKALKYALFC